MNVFIPPETFRIIVRNTPLVSIDLIVRNREGNVLLGFRRNRPAQGCWFVPGGRIAKNERREEAIRRISETELGLRFSLGDARLFGVYDHIYPDNALGDPAFGTHYVVVAYEVNLPAGQEPRTDGQHDGFKWMSPSEILASSEVHSNTRAYFQTPV